jgi:hypothetical protein
MLSSALAFFVDAVGRVAATMAEASRKTHHPEFLGDFCGNRKLHHSVRIEGFFTVNHSFFLDSHRYWLTPQSQPFDNGQSFL